MRHTILFAAAILLLAFAATRAVGQSSPSDTVAATECDARAGRARSAPLAGGKRPPARPKPPPAETIADGGVVQTPAASDGGAADADGGVATADGGVPAADGGGAAADGGVPAPPPPDPFAAKPLEEGADRQTGIRGRIVDRKTGAADGQGARAGARDRTTRRARR